MSTNKQRREAERVRLQRQLEQRREREAARKRFATIASIVGALVLVAAIVVVVVVATSGSKSRPRADAGGTSSGAPSSAAPSSAAPSSPAPSTAAAPDVPVPTTPCSKPPTGDTAHFAELTITGAKNLKAAPKSTGTLTGAEPKSLMCEDLVVGSGKAATTASQATVEYVGIVYKTGKVFQSSWDSSPATFGLSTGPGGVIAGFSQGIAGAGKVAPMKEGGRRVIVMPAAVAYGASPPPGAGIPANASLVFIVDLQKLAA